MAIVPFMTFFMPILTLPYSVFWKMFI